MFLSVRRSSRPGQGREGIPHRELRPGKVTERRKYTRSGLRPLQSRSERQRGGGAARGDTREVAPLQDCEDLQGRRAEEFRCYSAGKRYY